MRADLIDTPMIGAVVGSYRVSAVIGGGGMGTVYAAQHQTLGRRAAVKILHPHLSTNKDMIARMFTEARATSIIEHPGLVGIYDYGELPDGSAYIVMELLEGETLADRVDRAQRLSVDEAVQVARQVASAVGAAHQKGIVHRDLKPDNIFLVHDADVPGGERAKVLDFGIAKLAANEMQHSVHTKTGQLMGTPSYMSPEQCRGAATLDARADVYSLGCIVYEMLTGRPPFDNESMGEIIAAHLYGTPPRIGSIEPSVPKWLEAIVMRTLEKRPEDRQQTMDELSVQLGAMRAPTVPPVSPEKPSYPLISVSGTLPPVELLPWRRRGLVITITTGVIVAAATAALLQAREPASPPPAAPVAATVAPAPPRPLPVPLPLPVVPVLPAPAPPPAEPAPAPAPAMVMMRIASTPAGAEVFRALDGNKMGVTPLSLELPRSTGRLVFVLQLDGFRDRRVELPANADGTARVRLVKAPRPRPPVRARHDDDALDPFAP